MGCNEGRDEGVSPSMKLAIATAIALGALSHPVEAGPYCGRLDTFAPADEATLPVSPTIAMHVEDAYYNGRREKNAKPPRFHATIDGKRVTVTTRDKDTADGLVRFIKINSKRTGKLELWTRNPYDKSTSVAATYTITKDWMEPATASANVSRVLDTRLGPYRWLGHQAAVRVDVPAIAFTVRWRRDDKSRWQTSTVPASINSDMVHEPTYARAPHWGASEALIGQRMCGMINTVPLADLEHGIDVKLTATLPNGRTIDVAGLETLTIPPAPKATKAQAE